MSDDKIPLICVETLYDLGVAKVRITKASNGTTVANLVVTRGDFSAEQIKDFGQKLVVLASSGSM